MNLERVVVRDRSERGKLRFRGPQRAWFLHQILTQAFEDIASGEARDAAMVTAHGRMIGYLEVLATEDALLCHFEPELLDTLPGEISRYIFATQVEIADVSAETGLVLVAGDGYDRLLEGVDALVHPTSGLGVPAAYLWTARSEVPDVVARLRAAGAEETTEEELEAVRVAHGVPRWGYEMDRKTFPHEAGIGESAVHYNKGCYLGQEAMAKIHLRGKVNRRLFRVEADAPVERGAEVVVDGTRVGVVTSAAGRRALALLRHDLQPGVVGTAGLAAVRVVEDVAA